MDIPLDPLMSIIPEAELKRVFDSGASAEIDGTSLTCLDYAPLAQLIPTHWTVIDFGCSYNAQSYYFANHRRLISVDLPFNQDERWHFERFMPSWCELYEMTIEEWLEKHLVEIDLDETFAICSYVPNNRQVAMVRNAFKNLFVIYPSNKARFQSIFKQPCTEQTK